MWGEDDGFEVGLVLVDLGLDFSQVLPLDLDCLAELLQVALVIADASVVLPTQAALLLYFGEVGV